MSYFSNTSYSYAFFFIIFRRFNDRNIVFLGLKRWVLYCKAGDNLQLCNIKYTISTFGGDMYTEESTKPGICKTQFKINGRALQIEEIYLIYE